MKKAVKGQRRLSLKNKYLSLITMLLLFSVNIIAQTRPFPNTVNTSNDSTYNNIKGGLHPSQGLIHTNYTDTTTANRSPIANYSGAQIFVADTIWTRNLSHTKWLFTGTGVIRNDSLFAQLPAFFDSTTRSPNTILKILQQNGIISGGTITVDSCNSLYIPATVLYLNYTQYTTARATRLIVPANGSGFPRTDEVIDSLGYIILRIGVPSSTPVSMPYNAATEFVLGTYTIQAGASCVDISQIIVWDENVGTPTEWALSTSGTISANGNSLVNPFHLTKDIFVSTYTNGSQLIFTAASPVTVTASEVFNFWVYLNGAFGSNQFTINFLNGSTPVGNPVSFNSGFGFNPNDSNFYQLVAMAGSAFGLTNQTITTVVITFSGNDLSGAKGLYLDYLQLQNGATNIGNGHGVFNFALNATNDTIYLTRDDGRIFKVPVSSGSGGNTIYTGDDSITSDRTVFLNHYLSFQDSLGGLSLNFAPPQEMLAITGKLLFNTLPSGAITDSILTDSAGYVRNINASHFLTSIPNLQQVTHIGNTTDSSMIVLASGSNIKAIALADISSNAGIAIGISGHIPQLSVQPSGSSTLSTIKPVSTMNNNSLFFPHGNGVLGIAINGQPFDSTGNIAIATGGGTVDSVKTGYGLSGGTITTTGTIIVDSAALHLKFLGLKDSTIYYPYASNPKGYLTSLPSIPTQTYLGNVSGTTTTPVALNINWYNVKDYGAKGDSSTDDRAAIIKARDTAIAHGGGVLYFPAGHYFISDSIVFTKSIRLQGVINSAGIVNNISTALKDRFGPAQYISEIFGTINKSIFVVDTASDGSKPVVSFEYLSFKGDSTGVSTAGAMIHIRGNVQNPNVNNCTFYGGYIQVWLESAFYEHIQHNHFSAPAYSCLVLDNTIRNDTGDGSINDCTFTSGTFVNTTSSAVVWNAGGGRRLVNCKFDAGSTTKNTQFLWDMIGNNFRSATSDWIIADNSFENTQHGSINFNFSNPFDHLQIENNQLDPSKCDSNAIRITNGIQVVVEGNVITNDSTVNRPAMLFTSCTHVTLGVGIISDYATEYSFPSSTDTSIIRGTGININGGINTTSGNITTANGIVTSTNTSSTADGAFVAYNNVGDYAYVGAIGTTYAISKYQKNGIFGAKNSIYFQTDDAVTSGGTNSMYWLTGGTNSTQIHMKMDSIGRVGIGTVTPQKVFHTVGTVRHASLGTAVGDTTNNKPLGISSAGDLIPITYWPGSGGGGGVTGLTTTGQNPLSTLVGSTLNIPVDSSNVLFYGALPDGATDNTTAIQLAFNSHKNIFFPSGVYICSNVTLNPGQRITGWGDSSIVKFKTGSTGFMFEANSNTINIENINLDGGTNSTFAATTTGGTRSGLHVNNLTNGTILNKIYVHGFDSTGLAMTGALTFNYAAPVISASEFYYNYIGINTARDTSNCGEYSKIYGSSFHQNRYALYIQSGNTIITDNTATYNGYGIALLNTSNSAHGVIMGNEVNHNTLYGLYVKNVANGEKIIGNHFIGDINYFFDSSSNMVITGNTFAGVGVTIDTITFRRGNTNFFKENWINNINLVRTSDNFIVSDNYFTTPGTYLKTFKDLIADSLLNYTSPQLVVGAASASASSLLTLTSTTLGFLPPRMNTTQMNAISSPASGLQIYNTDSLKDFFYNGSAWLAVSVPGGGGGSGVTTLSAIGTVANANGATITGTTLNLQKVNASFGGVWTTGTDTVPGSKLFNTIPLNVTGTFPTSPAGSTFGVQITTTGAGSASQAELGLYSNVLAGYTGASGNYAIDGNNASAGTSTTGITGAGNVGLYGNSTGTTTGDDVGIFANAGNGNTSYGGVMNSITNKNSGTNVGFTSLANNTGTSPTVVAGYFGLRTTKPTYTTSVLQLDNGSVSAPILLCQVSGTTKFSIDASGNPNLALGNKLIITTGSNASVGTATLSSGTVTVSTTAVTAASKIFLTDATTGALTNVGSPTVGTITAGTSFVINSTNPLDASNINWWIIN